MAKDQFWNMIQLSVYVETICILFYFFNLVWRKEGFKIDVEGQVWNMIQ